MSEVEGIPLSVGKSVQGRGNGKSVKHDKFVESNVDDCPELTSSESSCEADGDESPNFIISTVFDTSEIYRDPSATLMEMKDNSINSNDNTANNDYNNEGRISDIGIHMLPNQRYRLAKRNGASFTMMVVGESGLGKTTFINTLFNGKIVGSSSGYRAGTSTVADNSNSMTPKTKINVHRFEFIENCFKLKFTAVDTPGFGDAINNNFSWSAITDFIDENNMRYMLQEEQPDRKMIQDTRINVCIYFLRPHGDRVSTLDVKAMKELSTRVNLIPVIAKADSLTRQKLKDFKEIVRNVINANGIRICEPLIDGSIPENYANCMPFAIIGSCEKHRFTDENGNVKQVRGRKYLWGVAEVENPDHCDFMKLKHILLEEYLMEMIDSSVTKIYENFRKITMQQRLEFANKADEVSPIIFSEKDGDLKAIYELKKISNFGLKFWLSHVPENNPVYKSKTLQLKKKFADIVNDQEQTFIKWKNALIQTQEGLNNDIKSTHDKVAELNEEVIKLEREIMDARQFAN